MIELHTFSGLSEVLGEERTVFFEEGGRLVIEGLNIKEAQQILAALSIAGVEKAVEEEEEVEEEAPVAAKPAGKKRGRPKKDKAEAEPEPEEVAEETPKNGDAALPAWVKECRSLTTMIAHLMNEEQMTDHAEILERMTAIRLLDQRLLNNEALQEPEVFERHVNRAIEKTEKETAAARA